MMECVSMREWILEVDPEELDQDATGEHAEHLAECAECRALADEILGAEAALRGMLDSVEPAVDVEAALNRAREAHRVTRRRRRWQVAVPLAAAGLGGLILFDRPPPVSVGGFDPATVAAASALGLTGARPLVRAESHERVAVLPTENPNITVIWFME